ncbi:MAG: sensor histidine kinase [Bacillota bacterium]|nr:sensor histidine kinase [Bacillota bacterium]
MSLFSFLSNAYRGTSFQNKLLLSYFVFIMIPLLILSVFSYQQSSAVITEQTRTISEMYLQQAKTDLNAQLAQMMSLSQQMSRQNRIRAILEQSPTDLTVSQQYDDLNELDEIVTRMVFTANIRNIRLYVQDGFLYSSRNLLTYGMRQLDTAPWFDETNLVFSGGYFTHAYTFTYLMSDPAEIISAISLIRSSRNFNQVIGVVTVDSNKQELLAILHHVDFSGQGRSYILDANNQVICGYRSEDGTALTGFEQGDEQYLSSEGIVIHDQTSLSGVSDQVWGGWRILVVSPVRPLLASASRLRVQLLTFSILVGIIVYFLAWFYARSNAGRIMGLVKKMRVVQTGNFDVNCIVDSADEIGELQSNFNLMIREIRLLLDEQYKLGQNLKDSELKVLQAQINPHFLYNTLDLILWTAKNNKPDEVSDIVIKLSRYYRLSLSNGQEFIKIRDELEHVRLYVDLQNMRFKRKIELETVAEPETLSLNILKLMLQPIVENSILHGIQNLDDREGQICIKVRIEQQTLKITVADNGIGIDRNELNRIHLREAVHRDDPGIGKFGLNNIMQRLRIYYGDDAVLTVESTPKAGTTVRIALPLQQLKQ